MTAAQKRALRVIYQADREGARAWISNVTGRTRPGGDYAVASSTAEALERAGLVEIVDVGRISSSWVCHLTAKGEEAIS